MHKNFQLPNNCVIFTDSLSYVKCLSSHENNNSLKSKIIKAINNYENEITIVWIPGHSNIEGNERADYLAKEAANNEMAKINEKFCTYEDMLRCMNTAIGKKWSFKWRRKVIELSKIKRTTECWKNIANLNRKDKVILTRLRIGHTAT